MLYDIYYVAYCTAAADWMLGVSQSSQLSIMTINSTDLRALLILSAEAKYSTNQGKAMSGFGRSDESRVRMEQPDYLQNWIAHDRLLASLFKSPHPVISALVVAYLLAARCTITPTPINAMESTIYLFLL